jgi:CBS-domain-containing membrane protein
VDDDAPAVGRRTSLREVLPLFIDEGDAPVAVVEEDGRLAGGIVRGSLIAGLTTSTESSEEGGEDFSGVGTREHSEAQERGR